jgi:hypothetical protein
MGPIHGFLLIVTLNRRISTLFWPKMLRPEPFALPSRDAQMCVWRATAALFFPGDAAEFSTKKAAGRPKRDHARMNPGSELRTINLKNK